MALHEIYHYNPFWETFRNITSKGCEYPIEPIDKETRQNDIQKMIDRGNHNSAQMKEGVQHLQKSYTKEVKLGWMIPITLNCVRQLKDAMLIPVGVTEKFSIDEKGNRIKGYCIV